MTTLAEIYENMVMLDVIRDPASFSCYHDGIMTFEIRKGHIDVQMSIICDDFMSNEEEAIDLINMKRITYFDLSVFDADSSNLIAQKTYRLKDQMN